MHGVDGLSLTNLAIGDRVELLSETEHWLMDKLSHSAYWLKKHDSIEGATRITPLGTLIDEALNTDWLQEKGHFQFMNHRTGQGDMLAEPITLLVWKKAYNTIEPEPEVAT